jgi:hypothetical protein
MTDVYEFSEYQRQNLVYSYITLTPEEIIEKKNNLEKFEAEKAAKKAAAEVKPAEKKAVEQKGNGQNAENILKPNPAPSPPADNKGNETQKEN